MQRPISFAVELLNLKNGDTLELKIEISYTGSSESLPQALRQVREQDFVQLARESSIYELEYDNDLNVATTLIDVPGEDKDGVEFVSIRVLLDDIENDETIYNKVFYALITSTGEEFLNYLLTVN